MLEINKLALIGRFEQSKRKYMSVMSKYIAIIVTQIARAFLDLLLFMFNPYLFISTQFIYQKYSRQSPQIYALNPLHLKFRHYIPVT